MLCSSAGRRLIFRSVAPVITLCLLLTSDVNAGKAKFNKVLNIGDAAPTWSDLPGIDGKGHSLGDYAEAKAVVIIFTCNHCPVAKDYEDRFIALAKKYKANEVQVVAISVNKFKADLPDKMRERAAAKGFPFPYLYDGSQQSGRQYGATATPHVFVLDEQRRVAYMGAFDDNRSSANVKKHYALDAIAALLAGNEPPVKESLQRGCGIEYESAKKD